MMMNPSDGKPFVFVTRSPSQFLLHSSAFQETLASFNDFSLQQNNAFAPSGSSLIDPDVDWSVLENAGKSARRRSPCHALPPFD